MRSSKINYLIVGTFVLASIIGLIVSVALLTGRTGATDGYHAFYSNVTGVKFGTQVVYEGYPIGQVTDVEPMEAEGRMVFRVNFDVTEGWKIPSDSMAEIAAPGLLAAITISITAGQSKESLAPGTQVQSAERADIFAVVSSAAGEFSRLTDSHIKPLIGNANKALSSAADFLAEGGDIHKTVTEARALIAEVRDTVADAKGLVSDLQSNIPQVVRNVDEMTTDLKASAKQVRAFASPANRKQLESLIGKVDGTVANMDKALVTMNSILADIDDMVMNEEGDALVAVKEARYVVESVSRHIDSINQNMEGAARNMYEFSRQIRQNPGLLLGGTPAEDQAKTQ